MKTNRKTTIQFIIEAKKVHGNKYDYTHTVYTGANNPISYYCHSHGFVNQSSASNHLAGKGCKLCKGKLITNKKTKSYSTFIDEANKIHPNLYNYSESGYVNRKSKIRILCNRCNEVFFQTPAAHLVGKGCNKCNRLKSTWEKEILRKNFRKVLKKHMFIYKTTNQVNGKIYIGQHSTNNLNDNYIGSGKLITKAIKKYGASNFKFQILQFASSYEELDQLEVTLISELATLDESIGYNLHRGGLGGNVYKKVNQYQLNGKFIKTWSALIEASEVLSISYKTIQGCAKKIKKSAGGFQWKFHDEYQDCSDIRPYKTKTIKAVNQYHPNGDFIQKWPSAASAASALRTNASSIGQCCRGLKSVLLIGGYAWRFSDEFPEGISIKPISYKNSKKILQFSMDGTQIRTFSTVSEAAKSINIPSTNISKCCQDKRKSAGGFMWKYL